MESRESPHRRRPWAWHAYGEGEETEVKYHGGSQKKWWQPFHKFEEAIDKLEKSSKHPQPNVLLTEQGVVYFEGDHVTASEAWQNKANAEEIMNAYVKHPGQLSDQKQLTRFFYYSMRGEPGFDSGLLEAAQLPENLPKGFEKAKTGVSLPCLALYDLASGRVSYRPPSLWPDIDQAGAPAICRRLRQKPLTEQIKHGEREFAYGDGYFAKPGGRLRRDVRIEGCHGRPTILPESGGPENEPENFDLRDGLLTWDTAHPGFEFNEYPHSEGADRTRGMLYSYNLSTGRRHDWKLPRLPVRETNGRFSVVSVLGYSTHTANMVFWIATTAGAVTRVGVEVKSSAVYAARIG